MPMSSQFLEQSCIQMLCWGWTGLGGENLYLHQRPLSAIPAIFPSTLLPFCRGGLAFAYIIWLGTKGKQLAMAFPCSLNQKKAIEHTEKTACSKWIRGSIAQKLCRLCNFLPHGLAKIKNLARVQGCPVAAIAFQEDY